MFQFSHTWFIVAQVMSFGEWLSIIARSELGSDLDCSVINARSELGSDLDCYELRDVAKLKKSKHPKKIVSGWVGPGPFWVENRK